MGIALEPIYTGPLSPEQFADHRNRLNLPTRRWSRSQITELIAEFLLRNLRESDRKIAEEVGIGDHKRVGRGRKSLVGRGALPQVATREGRDGKCYRPGEARVRAGDGEGTMKEGVGSEEE